MANALHISPFAPFCRRWCRRLGARPVAMRWRSLCEHHSSDVSKGMGTAVLEVMMGVETSDNLR